MKYSKCQTFTSTCHLLQNTRQILQIKNSDLELLFGISSHIKNIQEEPSHIPKEN